VIGEEERRGTIPHQLGFVPEELTIDRGPDVVLGKLAKGRRLDARVGWVDER
jgi:hypothetical protein